MAAGDRGERLHRWRPSGPAQAVTLGVAAALATCAVLAPLVISPREPANLLFTPFFLAFSLFFVYLGTGWVDLYPKAVVIGGLMRRRREIQLSDLGSVAPGRYGLCFRRVDGSSSVGGPEAIGATGGVPNLFGLKTRGDRIAEAIMRQAAETVRDSRT